MTFQYSTPHVVTMGDEVGPLSIKSYLTPGVINMEFEIRMGKTELFLTIRTNWFDLYRSINQFFLFCVQYLKGNLHYFGSMHLGNARFNSVLGNTVLSMSFLMHVVGFFG